MIPSAWLALLVLLATLLIFRGRKRYVGTEPHCRKCNYLLHGLESGRCPECGSMLSSEAITQGEPRRRVVSLVLGWLLILGLGLLIVSGEWSDIQQIDWYHYLPTYLVLHDLNSTNQASQTRAWTELSRRDGASSLSADARNQLVLFALNEQANATFPPSAFDRTLIDYLGGRLAAGDLPLDQQKKICEQSLLASLVVRPKVIVGDPVPYTICHFGQGPNNLCMRLIINGCAIDGKTIAGLGGLSGSFGLGGVGSMGSSIPPQPIGPHQLAMTCRIDFFISPPNAFQFNTTAPPLYTIDRTFTAKFEVFSKSAGLSIQQINDPKLATAMKAAISLGSFRYGVTNHWIQGTIHFNHVPANAAFDVVARYNGTERSLGSAIANANCGLSDYEVMSQTTPPPPASIEILLRPSEKVASGTVDMLNYWNQEVDFPNVPLPRH
jgi:hypothetical protein